ncbi:MAG: hypothetical protein WCK42_04025 [Myxococcaceae bacterium]
MNTTHSLQYEEKNTANNLERPPKEDPAVSSALDIREDLNPPQSNVSKYQQKTAPVYSSPERGLLEGNESIARKIYNSAVNPEGKATATNDMTSLSDLKDAVTRMEGGWFVKGSGNKEAINQTKSRIQAKINDYSGLLKRTDIPPADQDTVKKHISDLESLQARLAKYEASFEGIRNQVEHETNTSFDALKKHVENGILENTGVFDDSIETPTPSDLSKTVGAQIKLLSASAKTMIPLAEKHKLEKHIFELQRLQFKLDLHQAPGVIEPKNAGSLQTAWLRWSNSEKFDSLSKASTQTELDTALNALNLPKKSAPNYDNLTFLLNKTYQDRKERLALIKPMVEAFSKETTRKSLETKYEEFITQKPPIPKDLEEALQAAYSTKRNSLPETT